MGMGQQMGIYLENRYSIRYKQTKYSKLDTSSLSPSTPQYFRVYHFTSAAATTPTNVYLFTLVIFAFQHIFPIPLQVESQPHRILSSNNCIEWGRGSVCAICCGRGRKNESILYCWRMEIIDLFLAKEAKSLIWAWPRPKSKLSCFRR